MGRMDGSMISDADPEARTRAGADGVHEGFPGERMRVLPRPLVADALSHPVTAPVLVTDAGYFPHASLHGRARRSSSETIIIQCTRGAGVCEMGGMRHEVRTGQILVIPAGTAHRYHADDRDPWTIWWLHVTGEAIGPLLEALPPCPVIQVVEPTRVSVLMDRVLRRMEADETIGSLVAAGGAAWHLLSVLVADATSAHPARSDPIREVRRHLRENVAQRIAVADLAAMAGYSESHFSALFRQATGFGALEYQTRLRMSRARELLDTTDLPVSSIAVQVGYADPMYFSRQFRRIHGISPSAHRRRAALEPLPEEL